MVRRCILLTIVIALAGGCAPRGETKSLDELAKGARLRFQSAAAAGQSESLQKAAAAIDELLTAKGAAAGAASDKVAKLLANLSNSAGYTVRPALAELIEQYRGLAAGDGPPSQAAVKLLVARTFHLLASELETTRFGIA